MNLKKWTEENYKITGFLFVMYTIGYTFVNILVSNGINIWIASLIVLSCMLAIIIFFVVFLFWKCINGEEGEYAEETY